MGESFRIGSELRILRLTYNGKWALKFHIRQIIIASLVYNQLNYLQASKYLKIGTCPASQKILAYMGKNLIFTRSIKIFTCPAVQGTRKYERTSAIFEP